ncbi:MAG: Gfo/Idh/MocA family oxidoreductase [Bacteroidota bacterium]
MKRVKGVVAGAGYFSLFHLEAWSRIEEVEITAICDLNESKSRSKSAEVGINRWYTDYKEMLSKEQPDFVDIITPPASHLELTLEALDQGIHVICQKPLAPTYEVARQMVAAAERSGCRFMVHENWRFQPWYREIKKLLQGDVIGAAHSVYFRQRMGDGWGEQAYIPRQPFFREYPRLLVYENGVHFIDTFRYLYGEIDSVFAKLRRLNPVIKGEDCALVHLTFANGMHATWDANRYNEPNHENPRYTFGEMLIDGMNGSLRLYPEGQITIQKLGGPETSHAYHHPTVNFSGDCVYATQRHFITQLQTGADFETNGPDYLKNLKVQDAVYQSAAEGRVVLLQ